MVMASSGIEHGNGKSTMWFDDSRIKTSIDSGLIQLPCFITRGYQFTWGVEWLLKVDVDGCYIEVISIVNGV